MQKLTDQLENLREFYRTLQNQTQENAVETLLLQSMISIDWAYYRGSIEAKTSPEQLAWDKWEDQTKNYFVELWSKKEKFKTDEDLLGAIRSKYGMKKRKQNLWDLIQRETKKEYDTIKKEFDKEGKAYQPLERLVSNIPTPDTRLQKKMLKEYIDELGDDVKAYRDYLQGKGNISKFQACRLKKNLAKRIEHLI